MADTDNIECPLCRREVRTSMNGLLRKHWTKPKHLGGKPCQASDRKVIIK